MTGDEETRRRAFRSAFLALEQRIKLFLDLPLDKLDRLALKRQMDEIGRPRQGGEGNAA